MQEVNFRPFWSGVVKCFCGNALVSTYIPLECFCWSFMVYTCKTSASTSQRHLWSNSGRTPAPSWWDHAESLPSKKSFHSEQPLLPQPGVYKNTQMIKIICQKPFTNYPRKYSYDKNTWKLGNAFASFIIFQIAQERGEVVQYNPDDQGLHLANQLPRSETTISGSWTAQWLWD